ncbi:Variant SH3 domain containing protein [Trichomonas vaginalis G3]|uniref:Variant SH3 domain containing protein n=1 Tax=Trichomonas vaginalis (strain ATCC PRA-98 / G3) TaxID=412133 RepID=A2E967_TRIV3|nr:SH3-domain family [Trichomonas vaginalis G3]EAY10752.1 Variant SH3 domain containing protein [Trichomonas vaginalis G3]KAI5536110.1 SH3-domain family [Trichomonas vaginalis G3]|eukprot:XP_001322975.1 Variant SH3 domain containing protein [Trichomonas vaginalis G3]
MKASIRQKAAVDTIAYSISLVTELVSCSKKNIDKAVKWFNEARSYLKKISEGCQSIKKSSNEMHPMLECCADRIFRETYKAMDSVSDYINEKQLQKALDFAQNYDGKISQVNTYMKQTLDELVDLYENFVKDTFHPIQSCIKDCASYGYDAHCGYLRYSNFLDEIEKTFNNHFADMKDIDDRLIMFEAAFIKSANLYFIKHCPHAAKVSASSPYQLHDEQFAKIVKMFRTGFQGFRSPWIPPVHVFQFDFKAVKMRALKDYQSTKVGEISIQEGEKVEAINTSFAEYYKIRTSNGMEGFVPVTMLCPYS